MEASSAVGLTIFSIGGILSAAVWFCGYLLRKRLRGITRIIMMTVFLIMWYCTLLPLTDAETFSEALRQPAALAVHSIWFWWAAAVVAIEQQVRKEAKRTNWKTGMFRATGVHIVTQEIKKIRERREKESGQPLRPDSRDSGSGI